MFTYFPLTFYYTGHLDLSYYRMRAVNTNGNYINRVFFFFHFSL